MNTTKPLEELLTERDVARVTGISLSSIRRKRLLRQPPVYVKLLGSVRYRPGDIAAWIESCVTGGGNTEAR